MTSYLGPHLVPSQGVFQEDDTYLLVVVHYRPGVMGFLSVESELAPPNVGLYDQQMALQFIHNISETLRANKGVF